MRPPEVLDRQAALLEYLGTANYRRWMTAWMGVGAQTGRFSLTEDQVAPEADQQLEAIRRSLEAASAFHVQPDMLPLVQVAAADLEPDDFLSHEVLPAEHGFLMFDRPLVFTDMYGGPGNVSALSWSHGSGGGQPGVWLTAWRDTDLYYRQYQTSGDADFDRVPGQGAVEFERSLGGLCIEQRWFTRYGDPVGPSKGLREEQYARLTGEREFLSDEADSVTHTVVALFRLLGQTIVDMREVKPDRATTRRMMRKKLPARAQTVKLRRREVVGDPEAHGEGQVEWKHSWIVRGHWAWRACGEDHVLAEPYEKGHRARVYIAPYVKGPDGKPLLVTDKVWSLAQ